MIDSLRADGRNFAVVDLGDFMSTNRIVEDLESRFLWQKMEQIGYIASTPGIRELNNWNLYKELMQSGRIVPVSSDLTVVENGLEAPAGRESYVADVGGVSVGFFALVGENEMTTVRPPAGIEFKHKNSKEAAERIVPELRKKAEVVVLMSQLPPEETDQLIQDVPGIDVALYGRRPSWSERAAMTGSTITQQTGIRGQFLGELVLIVDPDGRIVDWGSRNRSIDAELPEDAEIAAEVKKLQDDGKELVKKNQETKSSELEQKLSSERFIGVTKCRRCHEAEHRQWAETAHARAWNTLVGDGKEKEKECVGCHVTGWESPSGFQDAVTSPELVNVQCEACHEVGTRHARGPDAPKVTEATCTSCHTGEWRQGFDFSTYLARVDHTRP